MGAVHSSSRAAHAHGNTGLHGGGSSTNLSAKGRRSFSKDLRRHHHQQHSHSHHSNHYPTTLHYSSSSGHLHLQSHSHSPLQHQYPSPNTSSNTLHPPPSSPSSYPYHGNGLHHHHHQQQQQQQHSSTSPPSSSNTSHSSSLQKAFGKRRSSNQTVDESMSMASSYGSVNFGYLTPTTTSSSATHQSIYNGSNTRYSGEHGAMMVNSGDQEFRWLNGRRYHNTGSQYMLPNDTDEIDRLHLQHYLFKMIMNDKNIHVPIPKENGRVLDLGCGPATWTMDMATELTTVHFVGVDISPIYPALIHPRNCSFHKEDILHGVQSQAPGSFDVVYQRNVAPGFTVQDWQRSFEEAFRLLKPGGWFESVETDVSVQEAGPVTNLCFEHVRLSMAGRNVDPTVVKSLSTIMITAGFVDVQVNEYCVPLGDWGGKVGQLWQQNMVSILDTVKPHLAKAAKISEGQVGEMIQSMGKETKDYRSFQTIYVTYGRKPL